MKRDFSISWPYTPVTSCPVSSSASPGPNGEAVPITLWSKLESRGHVTWREYDPIGGVYHLFSKTLYRCIGKENLPTRRRHSVEFIRTRLLLLDFILENCGFAYFETEPEKTAYFCDVLGIPREALPAKTYEGGPRSEPTVRYFVDKFPMFLDHTVPVRRR